MIRPETLLHNNEVLNNDIRAPARIYAKQPLCGLEYNGFFCQPACLQKFATHRVFVVVLATLGFLQGAAMGYFTATANVVANNYGFSRELVGWMLVFNEIIQGVFGLAFSFWGGRGHRPGWIATCATIHALTCLLLLLPHVMHGTFPGYSQTTNTETLCTRNVTVTMVLAARDCIFTAVLMFLVQLGAGLGAIAVLALGLSFVDDHVNKGSSAAFIGEIIALRHLGPYMGVLLAWRFLSIYSGPLDVVPELTSPDWVGAWWLGWPIMSGLMFVVAILIAMFPSQLPSQTIKEMAASIVDLARGVRIQEPVDPALENTGFCWSLRRLLTNRIIVLNTLATVCLHTAMTNYLALEDQYLESKFHIPRPFQDAGGFNDPWTSRLTITVLEPPLVALHILVSGLVISKIRLRAGRLTGWHTALAVIVAIFMFSRLINNCPLQHLEGEENGSLKLVQLCNRQCSCPESIPFSPVCSEQGSFLFYSPCHAGCTHMQTLDNMQTFANCSCVQYRLNNSAQHSALGGPCHNPRCNLSWILDQCFTLLTAALVGTRLVGNAILTFRSVQLKDKALAVGLELTSVGLIAYIPGKLLYRLMADLSCMHRGDDGKGCKLYDAELLGRYINITSGCLMILCAILSAIVWYFARHLDFYASDDIVDYDDLEMKDMHRKRNPKISSRQATPAARRRKVAPAASSESIDMVASRDNDETDGPHEVELTYNVMDMSDHMEDSMEDLSPKKRMGSGEVY